MHAIFNPSGNVANECVRRFQIALAAPERNKLGICINRAERPNVAILRVVVLQYAALFLTDKAANFVKLEILTGQIANAAI